MQANPPPQQQQQSKAKHFLTLFIEYFTRIFFPFWIDRIVVVSSPPPATPSQWDKFKTTKFFKVTHAIALILVYSIVISWIAHGGDIKFMKDHYRRVLSDIGASFNLSWLDETTQFRYATWLLPFGIIFLSSWLSVGVLLIFAISKKCWHGIKWSGKWILWGLGCCGCCKAALD